MNQTPVAAAVSAQLDPFDAVLLSLKESAHSVEGIVKPIADVDSIVVTVDDVLAGLSKIPQDLNIIKEILKVLDAALMLLTPVPIVGEIANVGRTVVTFASETCGTVQQTAKEFVTVIIDPVKTAFDDLRAGIQKAISILKTIAQTIPDYINTIQILNYMNKLAIPLVGLFKETDAGKRLDKLTKEFDALQKEVTKILGPVAEFIKDLGKAIGAIDQVLGKAFQEVKNTAVSVLNALRSIENVFRPIRDGFNKILHAIKPVKWALDALSFIFDKVVKPVIEKILKKTGLEAKIFDPIKREVEEKLGIEPIVDMLEGKVSKAGADLWQKGAGSAAAGLGGENWEKLAVALARYNTRDNKGTKEDIMLLLNAITGGEVDPDKPPPKIPDWPHVPDFDDGDQTPAGKLFADALSAGHRQLRLENGFSAMAEMQQASFGVKTSGPARLLLMDLMDSDELLAADDMSNVGLLKEKASAAADALRPVEGIAGSLMTNLELFDQARHLPADFDEQMDDFARLFGSSVEFADFLGQVSYVEPLVRDLVGPLKNHAMLATEIKTSANGLVSAGRTVDAQIQALEAAAPRADVFTDAFEFFDAAACGAISLQQVIAAARQVDHEHLGDQFKDRLDGLAGQVDAAASVLISQLNEVESLAKSAMTSAETINTFLAGYGKGFTDLHGDAAIVSTDALPSLTKGVHYFGIFVSILDPLSCLMNMTVCKDADNTYKKTAAGYIKTIEEASQIFFSDNKDTVEKAFSFVIEQKVPMSKISKDINAIVEYSQSGQKAFDSAVTRVKEDLSRLTSAMKPAQQYVEDGQQIDNVLVDEAFARSAGALFEEIQNALPPAFEPA